MAVVVSAPCRALTDLRGVVVLDFTRTDWTPISHQVTTATAHVNTDLGTLTLYVKDMSRFAVSESTRAFPRASAITDVLSLAQSHIASLGMEDCTANVSLVEDGWHVRCGALATFESRCAFAIVDGRIAPAAQ